MIMVRFFCNISPEWDRAALLEFSSCSADLVLIAEHNGRSGKVTVFEDMLIIVAS